MKQQNKEEENRKYEKRFSRRKNLNGKSVIGKNQRIARNLRKENFLVTAARALKDDNTKKKPDDKRPGPEKFLAKFSFIPWTLHDKRDCVPENYHCHSYNEQRQYIDFFKEFIYPYNVPVLLFWTAFENETVKDENGRDCPSPDYEIINLAKKWICDITGGESFYKKNKDWFTKAEAHYFLISDIPYLDPLTVIEQYFYAKCIARKLDVKSSENISKTFSIKFSRYLNHPIVTDFLDFIARSDDFAKKKTELGDICDFIFTKIKQNEELRDAQNCFSFSGRTLGSIIALANEWHADVIHEQEVQYALAMARQRLVGQKSRRSIPVPPSRWNGISVSYSRLETTESIWQFSQLHTVRELLNEGRKMKNCVSSYSIKCASGDCSIFHVSCSDTNNQRNVDIATLEISRNRILVQAKSKCNGRISPATKTVIGKWAQLNRIKVDLLEGI